MCGCQKTKWIQQTVGDDEEEEEDDNDNEDDDDDDMLSASHSKSIWSALLS